MNQTTNYKLNQWQLHDRVMMQDFNADNAKIDAALGEHAATLNTHTGQIAKLGNCQVYTTTYTGNGQCGEEHPSSLTFPKKPLMVMITDNGYSILHLFPFNTSYSYSSYPTIYVKINWSGNTVTWSASTTGGQMTNVSQTYHVIAFYAMD